jgi:hypothetical protein
MRDPCGKAWPLSPCPCGTGGRRGRWSRNGIIPALFAMEVALGRPMSAACRRRPVPKRPSIKARSCSRVCSGADILFIASGLLLGANGPTESPFSCFDSGRVHPNASFQQAYPFTHCSSVPRSRHRGSASGNRHGYRDLRRRSAPPLPPDMLAPWHARDNFRWIFSVGLSISYAD